MPRRRRPGFRRGNPVAPRRPRARRRARRRRPRPRRGLLARGDGRGDARPSTAPSLPAGPAGRARRPPREDRLLHPLAGLLLEPRQRPLPARRRCASSSPAAMTSPSYEPAERLEPRRTSCADHGEAGLDAFRAAYPGALAPTPSAPISTRPRPATAPTSSSSTNGTSPALVAAIGARPPRRRPLHPALPRHPPPRGQRPGGDPRLRPLRLRRRARLRRGARPRSTGAGAGASGSSSGTRPPTSPSSARPRSRSRAPAWSGSATGATASAPPSSRPSCSRPPPRPACPLDVHGVRYPTTALDTLAARTAPATAAGCQRRRAGGLRPPPRHRARAAAVLRRRAARHPDDPRLRGAGLRHPAGLAPHGTTPRGCSAPARTSSSPRDGDEMARAALPPAATIADLRAALAASGLETHPRPPHLRATASTSCSPSAAAASGAPVPHGGRAHEDRLLRLEPALGLLERRRHLLPRPALRARRARPRHHLLRARRLRPAAAPRHRPARLGRVVVWPATEAAAPRRRRRGGRGRRRGQGERRRRLRRPAARGVDGRRPPGRDPHLLGRRCAGDARRDARRPRPPAPPRRCPRSTSCSPTAAAPPVVDAYAALGARAACRSTTRSTPRPITRSPPDPRFAADLALPRQPPARPRGAGRGVLPRPAARLPDRRFLLGGNGWDDKPMPANVRRLGHVGTARAQRLQLPRRCAVLNVTRDSMAGDRLLAGDPGLRGRRRRRLPDHRRLGGHRALPRPRTRRSSSPATARTSPTTSPRLDPGAGARRSAPPRCARVLAEHTYARRAAQVDAPAPARPAAGDGCAHERSA